MATKKYKKKRNYGGAREGSGRKKNKEKESVRSLMQRVEVHANEVVGLKLKDTNKIIKKQRILFILDVLYNEAVNKRNIPAIKEYLDRTMGKSKQSIEYEDKNTSELEQIKKDLKKIFIKKKNGKRNKNSS